MTFLRDHKNVIAGMDFVAAPAVRSRLLHVWFAIHHGRRRILRFNVTADPTSRWVIRRLRGTFPDEASHRHLIYDNDSIFSAAVTMAIERFPISPKRRRFETEGHEP